MRLYRTNVAPEASSGFFINSDMPIAAMTGKAHIKDSEAPGKIGGTCPAMLFDVLLHSEKFGKIVRARFEKSKQQFPGTISEVRGVNGNVIRILSPLVIEENLLNKGLDIWSGC